MGPSNHSKLFKVKISLLLLWLTFIHVEQTFCANNGLFLTKYRDHIESYIMRGYGKEWKHCDILQIHEPSFLGNTPSMILDNTELHKLDIRATFSSSYCLLIWASVKSNQSLSELIKFGWSVIQHKRLALVAKFTHGLTLDMATNTTKLPFLIAAVTEDEKEQFLCPVIGEHNPRLQHAKCDLAYTSYKTKTLRVGVFGIAPNVLCKVLILHVHYTSVS